MFDLVQLVATNDPSNAKREMLAMLNFSEDEGEIKEEESMEG